MRTVTLKQGKICERFHIPTVEAWDDFAKVIANCLRPGDVVALSGKLGAGKTTFVQALAKAMGIKRNPPSPTFALMRTYKLPKKKQNIGRLIHVDAYRLEKEEELMVLDLDEELADAQSVLVMEWPEHVSRWMHAKGERVIRLSISS